MFPNIRPHDRGTLISTMRGSGWNWLAIDVLGSAGGLAIATVWAISSGKTAAAIVLGVLTLIFLFGFFKRRAQLGNPQPLWVTDPEEIGLPPPAPCEGTLLLSAAQLRRIRVEFKTNSEFVKGEGFEAWLVRSDTREEYPLGGFGALWFTAAIAQLTALAQRWRVPLELEGLTGDRARRLFSTKGQYLLLVPAALTLAFGLWTGWQQWRLDAWPQAQATIEMFDANTGGNDGGMHWYANPRIEFRYTVAGKNYTGNRLNPSPWNYQRSERFAADTGTFKPDAVVPCWYDPRHPDVAYVINTGVTADAYLLLGLGLVGIAATLWISRSLRRSKRIFDELI